MAKISKITVGNTTYDINDPNAVHSVTDGNPALTWSTKSKVATVGGVDIHVTMPSAPSMTDTKNTAGATDTSNKIFLIGATSQGDNPVTYSQDTAYVGSDGCLYSNSTKVSVEGHTHSYVPTSRTVNNKALSSDISLTYSDVGAAPSSHTHNYAGLASGESAGGKAASAAYADSAGSAPASDVYAWAKASTKPSYTHDEIGAGNLTIGDGSNRLMFRTRSDYASGIYYSTPGNESLVFANVNPATSWIFATINPTLGTNWTSLTPSLQIKNQRVAINKLIANNTDCNYNLDVNGTVNASSYYIGSGPAYITYNSSTESIDFNFA